jgi:hypothetical protein
MSILATCQDRKQNVINQYAVDLVSLVSIFCIDIVVKIRNLFLVPGHAGAGFWYAFLNYSILVLCAYRLGATIAAVTCHIGRP